MLIWISTELKATDLDEIPILSAWNILLFWSLAGKISNISIIHIDLEYFKRSVWNDPDNLRLKSSNQYNFFTLKQWFKLEDNDIKQYENISIAPLTPYNIKITSS